MARYSSSSSNGAGSPKATLVLMLLLGAVVAAHGRKVPVTNTCKKPIVVNGITTDVKAVVEVEVVDLIKFEVVDKTGVHLFGSYSCPAGVTALLLVYEAGYVKVKVAAAGLLFNLVGLVLGLLKATF